MEQKNCIRCKFPIENDITSKKVNFCQSCLDYFLSIRDGYTAYLHENDYEVACHLKECYQCGEVFWVKNLNQKYCSEDCIRNSKTNWQRKDRIKIMGRFKIRFEVFKRDGFKCVYCGRGVNEGVKLHLDHVYPKSKGGKDSMENYATSCFDCNIGKSNTLLED